MRTEAQNDVERAWSNFQYNPRSSKATVDPFDMWQRMRDECPVLHSDVDGGFWFVTRYDDVRTVLLDGEAFITSEGTNIPRMPQRLLPLESDPPLHRRYREILNPPVSPQKVAAMEPWMREDAQKAISRIADRSTIEVVHEFCDPYAKTVALKMLGYPLSTLENLQKWSHVLVLGGRDNEEGAEAGEKLFGFLADSLAEAMERPAADDVISVIARGEIDGTPLSEEEKLSLLLLITLGGLHTTSTILAGSLAWLADHPEDRFRIREADENFLKSAVEEFVRYVSATTQMVRTAAKDTRLSGCPIKHGDKVMFSIGSANHDERHFERPRDVILDRYPNKHFGFGAGPHRCVGSHFGKLAVRVGLEEFVRAFDFEIEDHHQLHYLGGEARGLNNLPLRIWPSTAAPAREALL
jgi:cytochrome P450